MRLPVIIINDCWEYIIEVELRNGQLSKIDNLLTIVQLLWMVHMCLHVLGLIEQT